MKTLTLCLILLCLALAAQAQLNPMTQVGVYDGEGWTDYFGTGLTFGDFDGDGREEMVAGAWGWNNQTGKNYFFQYENDWPDSAYMTVQGHQEYEAYDWSDANLGDINDDGFVDLGIPEFGYGPLLQGRLDVFFGSTLFDTIPDWTIHPDTTVYYYAFDLDSCGDINGDGFGDFLFGILPQNSPAVIEIYYAGQALDTILDVVFNPGTSNLQPLGDVNADGYADILTLDYNHGPVKLYFGGNPMDTIPDLVFLDYALMGQGGGVGDVNADNFADFCVPMYLPDSTLPRDLLYFGGPNLDDQYDAIFYNYWGDLNASFNLGSGDFNGDGVNDIVSATGDMAWGRVVYIYLGSQNFNGVPDALMTDNSLLHEFGSSLASGDMNGDGRDELAVTAGAYWAGNYTGRVYLYEGPATWIDYGAGAVAFEEIQRHPGGFILEQNYPNPFNAATTIHFEIGKPSTVNMAIYDLRGQKVKTLIAQQPMSPGGYNVAWTGKDDGETPVASGIYLLQMRVNNFQQIKKMLLIK